MADNGRVLIHATVTGIRDNEILYPSCTQCYSKMQQEEYEKDWFCFKCDIFCDEIKVSWRYRLSLTVADKNCLTEIALFGKTLEPYFGTTANKFHRILEKLDEDNLLEKTMLMSALEDTFLGHSFHFGIKSNARLTELQKFHSLSSPISVSTVSKIKHGDEASQQFKSDLVAVQIISPANVSFNCNTVLYNLYKYTDIYSENSETDRENPSSLEEKIDRTNCSYLPCNITNLTINSPNRCPQNSIEFSYDKSVQSTNSVIEFNNSDLSLSKTSHVTLETVSNNVKSFNCDCSEHSVEILRTVDLSGSISDIPEACNSSIKMNVSTHKDLQNFNQLRNVENCTALFQTEETCDTLSDCDVIKQLEIVEMDLLYNNLSLSDWENSRNISDHPMITVTQVDKLNTSDLHSPINDTNVVIDPLQHQILDLPESENLDDFLCSYSDSTSNESKLSTTNKFMPEVYSGAQHIENQTKNIPGNSSSEIKTYNSHDLTKVKSLTKHEILQQDINHTEKNEQIKDLSELDKLECEYLDMFLSDDKFESQIFEGLVEKESAAEITNQNLKEVTKQLSDVEFREFKNFETFWADETFNSQILNQLEKQERLQDFRTKMNQNLKDVTKQSKAVDFLEMENIDMFLSDETFKSQILNQFKQEIPQDIRIETKNQTLKDKVKQTKAVDFLESENLDIFLSDEPFKSQILNLGKHVSLQDVRMESKNQNLKDIAKQTKAEDFRKSENLDIFLSDEIFMTHVLNLGKQESQQDFRTKTKQNLMDIAKQSKAVDFLESENQTETKNQNRKSLTKQTKDADFPESENLEIFLSSYHCDSIVDSEKNGNIQTKNVNLEELTKPQTDKFDLNVFETETEDLFSDSYTVDGYGVSRETSSNPQHKTVGYDTKHVIKRDSICDNSNVSETEMFNSFMTYSSSFSENVGNFINNSSLLSTSKPQSNSLFDSQNGSVDLFSSFSSVEDSKDYSISDVAKPKPDAPNTIQNSYLELSKLYPLKQIVSETVLPKRVQFARRLSSVRNLQLVDIRLNMRQTSSPFSEDFQLKSCLRKKSVENLDLSLFSQDLFSPSPIRTPFSRKTKYKLPVVSEYKNTATDNQPVETPLKHRPIQSLLHSDVSPCSHNQTQHPNFQYSPDLFSP
ncbi:uncharacterized protein LOC126830164 [Patella vulgata]|uniref:uncharacterized protein LOC126830164 n=1 Tax=Patella vulgata TaxID=6465 RepID=UPI00217F7C29|nr:uncharacterized protein LOC126830164 [Patella vulgata]